MTILVPGRKNKTQIQGLKMRYSEHTCPYKLIAIQYIDIECPSMMSADNVHIFFKTSYHLIIYSHVSQA